MVTIITIIHFLQQKNIDNHISRFSNLHVSNHHYLFLIVLNILLMLQLMLQPLFRTTVSKHVSIQYCSIYMYMYIYISIFQNPVVPVPVFGLPFQHSPGQPGSGASEASEASEALQKG